MTLETTTSTISYLEDGVSTVFAVPFRFLAATDLIVERITADGVVTTLALTTDYSVTGADAAAGGSITRTAATSGQTLRIRRATARIQSTDYTTGDAFPAESHERALDRAMMIDQEQDDNTTDIESRSFLLPAGESFDLLPSKTGNAGKVLGLDAGLEPAWLTQGGADSALRTDLADSSLGAGLVAFIESGVGAFARSVLQRLRDLTPSVKGWNVDATGATSAVAALTAAAAIGPMVIPAGTYDVDANVTFPSDVKVDPGVMFNVGTGATLTFSSRVQLPLEQVFNCTGTGKVVFNNRFNWIGHPEWWGGTGEDTGGTSAAANDAAIAACIAACKVTFLNPGDWFISTTVKLTDSHKQIWGADSNFTDPSRLASRLLITSATMNALQLGPDAYPGSINAMPQRIWAKDLYVGRSTAPDVPSSGSGLIAQYCLSSGYERIKTAGHINGFRYLGTVSFEGWFGVDERSTAGTGGTDLSRGHWIDGSVDIGAAGGNASLHLYRPKASSTVAASTGFRLDGTYGFTDCWLHMPETSGLDAPIYVVGDGSATYNGRNRDLTIENAIIDAFQGSYGLRIYNVNKWGAVQIINPYITNSPTGGMLLYVQSCRGILVEGGQLLGNATAYGVSFDGSDACQLIGTQILDCGSRALDFNGSSNIKASGQIRNYNQACSEAAIVVRDSSCHHLKIDMQVIGMAGAFTKGIAFQGSSNTNCEVNLSEIDPACITGGGANKLYINAIAIGATGTYTPAGVASAPPTGTMLVGGLFT